VTNASTSEPIEDVEACAREVEGDGEQCGTANANGEYTILRLNGQYRVEFHSTGSHYLPEFYGGAFIASEASPVSVTAPGTTSGIDFALQPGIFEKPANTAPPVVSGTPAVGDVLSCSPGSWTGDPAPTFTYVWLRDGTRIAGANANASSYTAQSADEGHSVSCEVVAVGAAGNMYWVEHASSAGVLIAAGTVNETLPGAPSGPTPPTETTTGLPDSTPLAVTPLVTVTDSKLVISGATAPVSVECDEACQGSIELTAQVAGKHHVGKDALARRQTLVLATGSFSLTQGPSRTVVLRLTVAGRKLLAHANKRHPVAAKLILSVKDEKATSVSVLAV
jgi:hypothetical protein